MRDPTWESITKDPYGTIYMDEVVHGLRCLILRGPGSLCAYIGIPLDHPLAGKGYDDIPLNVHGGLTFAGKGDGVNRPEGVYWYGWDYAHAGDASLFDLLFTSPISREKKWKVSEVRKEVKAAAKAFIKILNLRGYTGDSETTA